MIAFPEMGKKIVKGPLVCSQCGAELLEEKYGPDNKWSHWKCPSPMDFRHESVIWDEEADRVLPGWEDRRGGQAEASKLIGCNRPFGPRRQPSASCESGKRNYCTCSACFD